MQMEAPAPTTPATLVLPLSGLYLGCQAVNFPPQVPPDRKESTGRDPAAAPAARNAFLPCPIVSYPAKVEIRQKGGEEI